MSVCAFDIAFTGPATDLLARARKGIVAQGGTLTGDAATGSFRIPVLGSAVAGTYAVLGQVAHFEIAQKPFLVSCTRIESTLAEFAKPPAVAAAEKKKRPKPAKPSKPGSRTKARPTRRTSKSKPARRAKRGTKKR